MSTLSFLTLPPGLASFLKGVQAQLLLDPNYLDRIPDPEVAKILEMAFGVREATPAPNIFEGRDEYEVILEEIQQTISELKTLEGMKLEVSDQIQFVKAKTALLERWSSLKERIWNVKEMAKFQATVVQYLEEVLGDHKDLRTEFMRRMKDLKTTGR